MFFINIFAIKHINNINQLCIFSNSSNISSFYYLFDLTLLNDTTILKSCKINSNHLHIKTFKNDDTSLQLISYNSIKNPTITLDKNNTIELLNIHDSNIRITKKTNSSNDYIEETFHNYDFSKNDTIVGSLMYSITSEPLFKLHDRINVVPLSNTNYLYLRNKNMICKQTNNIDISSLGIIKSAVSKRDIINFLLLRYLKQNATIEEYLNTHKLDTKPIINTTTENIEEYLGSVQKKEYRFLNKNQYNENEFIAPIDSSIVIYDNESINIQCNNNNFNISSFLDKDFIKNKSQQNHTISFNISLQDLRRIYQPYTAFLYKIENLTICDDFDIIVFHYSNSYYSPKSHTERDLGTQIYGYVREGCSSVSKPHPLNTNLNFKLVFLSPVKRATVVTTFNMDKDKINKQGIWLEQGTDLGFVGLTISNIFLISNRPIVISEDIHNYSYFGNDKFPLKVPTNIKALDSVGYFN
jgi:hypothetical protein